MTTETSPKVNSLCGAIKLLAAVYGVDSNELKTRYGLPVDTRYKCIDCGKPRPGHLYGRCLSCHMKYYIEFHHVKVACSECGELFEIYLSVFIPKRKRERKTEERFCSKSCYGKWLARNYGFIAQPENIHYGGGKKKWDYSNVYDLRDKTGWGCCKLSRELGIPRPTVSYILAKRRPVTK